MRYCLKICRARCPHCAAEKRKSIHRKPVNDLYRTMPVVPHTELQPWYTVISILSPRRAFLFSTRSSSVCGKPFRFFSLFPVVTRSAFLFLPTNCPCSRKVYRNFQLFHALFIRSSFLFFMIESIGGPYYRPQLEELLCTKPNSRATPKRRPALYMP